MEEGQKKEKEVFETLPIRKAALSLAVPTVISQLIVIVYNMSDTWFIGQTGDPRQVAAVTVAFPIFMLLNAIANLFGIGGGSLISRLIGSGEYKESGRVASFTIWSSAGVTLFFSLLIWLFRGRLLMALGAFGQVAEFTEHYLFWTILVGGVPTVLSLVFANLIRAQGKAKAASAGMSLGGILNVVLDPIFIFGFEMDVAGAALATCLSNTVSALFLLGYLVLSGKQSVVPVPLKPEGLRPNRITSLFSIGTPAALQILLAALSNSILIRFMAGYETAAVSAVGIMQKIEVIPFQVVQGISSGVLPLIAYSYAAKNYQRMNASIRMAITLGAGVALSFFVGFEWLAPEIVRFFISDSATVAYGAAFTRLRMTAVPFIAVEFMLIAVFQGIGCAKQAFILSVFRKGILDLPIMLCLNMLWPMYGLMLTEPVMESCGAALSLVLYMNLRRRLVLRPQDAE